MRSVPPALAGGPNTQFAGLPPDPPADPGGTDFTVRSAKQSQAEVCHWSHLFTGHAISLRDGNEHQTRDTDVQK
jgi:hypothetical protein